MDVNMIMKMRVLIKLMGSDLYTKILKILLEHNNREVDLRHYQQTAGLRALGPVMSSTMYMRLVADSLASLTKPTNVTYNNSYVIGLRYAASYRYQHIIIYISVYLTPGITKWSLFDRKSTQQLTKAAPC